MKTYFMRVSDMTHKEKVEMYNKLSKKQIINMLIESNKILWPNTQNCCNHKLFPLPSVIDGVQEYQCFICGIKMTSTICEYTSNTIAK